jgi:hypothetical protein
MTKGPKQGELCTAQLGKLDRYEETADFFFKLMSNNFFQLFSYPSSYFRDYAFKLSPISIYV